MMVTIYTGDRCTVGSDGYRRSMAQAEGIAQRQRNAGKPAVVRWDDEYNDYSARGRFVVTSRG